MSVILEMGYPNMYKVNNSKYDALPIEGYRHAANSSDEKEADVIARYKRYYNTNNILVVPFNPDGRDSSNPLWPYTTKWAIYLPIAK